MPYGLPRMMSVALYPMEIIQRPEQITIVTEAFSEVRRVFMNQPQLPIDEVPPGYYGHSVGRWEGDTLVVDTVGIKTSIPAYQIMPHSDQMRITERIRLVAPDYLHDQITIEDPVALEKPVTYTLAYRRMPNYKMVEFVCENNREYVDANGAVRLRARRSDSEETACVTSDVALRGLVAAVLVAAAAMRRRSSRRPSRRRRSARWRRRT